jgi:hypothetical protein
MFVGAMTRRGRRFAFKGFRTVPKDLNVLPRTCGRNQEMTKKAKCTPPRAQPLACKAEALFRS